MGLCKLEMVAMVKRRRLQIRRLRKENCIPTLKKLIDQSSLNQFGLANGCKHIKAASHSGGEKIAHSNRPPEVSMLIVDEAKVNSENPTHQSSITDFDARLSNRPPEVSMLIVDEAKVNSENPTHQSSITDFDARLDEKLEPSTDPQCPSKLNTSEPEILSSSSSISVISNILEAEWENTSFRKRSSALNFDDKRPFTTSRGSTQNYLPRGDREHSRNRSRRTLSNNLIGTTSPVVAKELNSIVTHKFSHVLTLGDLSDSFEEVEEKKRVDFAQERTQVSSELMLIRGSDKLSSVTLDRSAQMDVGVDASDATVNVSRDLGASDSNNRASNDMKCANASSYSITSADSLSTSVQKGPLPSRRMDRCISFQNFDTSADRLSASIHNSCSAECIMDILKIDPYNLTDERQDSVDRTNSDTLSSSMSSDEGIGVSDCRQQESRFTSHKEDLNGVHISPDMQAGNSKHNLNRSFRSIDRSTLCQKHQNKSSFLLEMAKFYDQQERAQKALDEQDTEDKEDMPETGPNRRRSRRRASCVLCFAQASIGKGSFPSLLFRYQVSSLGCSNPYTSQYKLRKLIMDCPRNSEAQYYKLSYEREPQ